MSKETFASASGLRPASAFVVIAAVLFGVALQVVRVSFARQANQPGRLREERGLQPAYSIADARGQVLARFVPDVCLEMSPRSMWQAHTPRLMAERLSLALGGLATPDELLAAMLPDARGGVIEVDDLELTPRQAERVRDWLLEGPPPRNEPVRGIWLERVDRLGPGGRPEPPTWRLSWRPEVLLSAEERQRHGTRHGWRWSRRIADGLAASLREPEEAAALLELTDKERERVRQEVWKHLIPTAFTRPVRDIPPERMLALREELSRQGVLSWQMRIAHDKQRAYPTGHHELFGSWGYRDAEATEPLPRTGLERLCYGLLGSERWALPAPTPEVYVWRSDRTVRGRRANGYVSFAPASAPPSFETTLDLSLQTFVREALTDLMEEHRPAVAMALVCDVATGDVLAVESVEAYEIQPFAPIWHVFTTGSTFKVITMAAALDQGVVDPSERIDVGQGAFRIVKPDGTPTARVIREAQGAPTGVILASECVARSSNAGMSQIGLRIDDEVFHGYLTELGYGRNPGSGLGSERAGLLPTPPWTYHYTHASLGFGHEISTTLWQHATGLATVLRGGVLRPLRLVRAIEQSGLRREIPPAQGRRVFREGPCNEVREMMRLGALEGTGDTVRELFEESLAAWLRAEAHGGRRVRDPSAWDLGTKTGTAEKVGTEICLHVELGERNRWREAGLTATTERVEGLREIAPPHASCYTSSICVFGRRPGDDRELMVLVVAEEPQGKKHFGSQVAGPTAERILSEALGLTANAAPPAPEAAPGFGQSALALENPLERPWRYARTEEEPPW